MVDLIARQLFSPNFNNENFFKFLKKKLSRRITPFIFFGGGGVTKKSAAAAFGGGVHHCVKLLVLFFFLNFQPALKIWMRIFIT